MMPLHWTTLLEGRRRGREWQEAIHALNAMKKYSDLQFTRFQAI
jgi:hypothetical protein